MEPIKIVVQGETQQAVQELAKIPQALEQTAAAVKRVSDTSVPATNAIKEVAKHSGNSRLAMMELGHVARATAEGLAAGISPTRMLALELPRLAQAASLSGVAFSALIPAIAGVAALVGGGFLVWNTWTSATRQAEKAAKDLETQMEGVAKIFTQLRDLQKAGLLSPQAVQKTWTF